MASWLSLAVILDVLIAGAGAGIGFIVAGMLAAGKIEDLRADNSMLSRNLDKTQQELRRTRARLERLTDRDPETGRFVRREPREAV